MKLPEITTRAVEQLRAPETPQQAAATAAAPFGAALAGIDAASKAYDDISAVSLSRAETKSRKAYVKRWTEFTNRESVSTDELDSMGVDYDPNLATEATTVGPDGSQTTARMVPTWAVAEAAHRRLTGQIADEFRPTATDAAARRYQEDFDLTYGAEAQAQVSEWAADKRREYQRSELIDSVSDSLEVGDYGLAHTVLNRAYAAGQLDDETYRDEMSRVEEIRERSGYVDVIENGTLADREGLLEDLLQGIQMGDESYHGELIVEERQRYINQLQAVIKAEREGSTDKSMAGLYLQQAKDALANGDQWSENLSLEGRRVIASMGNARQQVEFAAVYQHLQDQHRLFSANTAQAESALAELRARSGDSLDASMRYEAAVKSLELKEKLLAEDPVRFALEYGAPTDAYKMAEEAGSFDIESLLRDGPGLTRQLLQTRQVLMTEAAGQFGADKLLLTQPELYELRDAWRGADVADRLLLAGSIAQLGPDQSSAIFDQLAVDGTVEGYTFPAAGAALAAGNPDAARLIITSGAMAEDPQVRNYANQSRLRDAVRQLAGNGLELTLGAQGRENFLTAATNLYAYQAQLQGIDPKSVDADLLQQSLNMVSGGQLTTYGNTRVRPPAGMTPTGMDVMFKRADGAFWADKLAEGDYRFEQGSSWLDGEGLKQELHRGTSWLVNTHDGTGGYYLMHNRPLGNGFTEPAIRVDADGQPIQLFIDAEDYVPRTYRLSGHTRREQRGR